MDSLINKIERKSARLGIIGMGYVGLPLALEFCKAGFDVTGIDLDKKKIDSIDYKKVVDCSKIIVDTRNATKGIISDKVVKL